MSLQSIGQNLLNNNFLSDIRSGLGGSKAGVSDAKLQTAETNTVKSTEAAQKAKPGFFDQLLSPKNSKETINLESMTMRFSELQAKGKLVRLHPLPGVVKDYVKDLKSFLGDIKDQAYQSEHKDELFQRIKIVDENLDKLVDQTLSDQKREIAVVASLGELQGLLIDVFA
jgi:uncharacterized protein YaaR (DUF327 family)